MIKSILLSIVLFAFIFTGCSGLQTKGLDPSTFKQVNVSADTSKDTETEDLSGTEETAPVAPAKEGKVQSSPLSSATDGSAPPSLGLEKKITPKENKGPAENSKAKSGSSAKQKQSEKSGSSDGGNTSALWGEINKLKNRVGGLEDLVEFAHEDKIHNKLAFFKPGSEQFTKEGEAALNEIATKASLVLIKGNASKSGTATANQILSQKRADAAANLLKAKNPNLVIEIRANGETDRYGENKNISISWK
ncbi:MAG: hypothetical protein US83_C0001G0041 [Candidatus Falkowbacteria bacterium GW2011_GWC2_38_22]|uniref:OmpA-like domain-containing protein n=1 Tax=Candidatus Falkowbacteria bacterium GW2011_GWE1_38_31 TaxID=1618638 RepID=A0A0G0JWC6_9BACT|nr:MAG: hypothetical protein US73_C0004G0087 [Candidatus Falkowbacteria bacterium GW2011_GWF2_38_1205]KKQ62107.1 MAG: hypothetical protein US83_C0001G0041 [Candidatus Falkowbacteria bacterium GW2011_GWC2_38_22]KKQ64257.1 MAG: hypothetical protein US84_C0001G0041 [Candidatus Falkowbacteria bacterium GW2011_GWF1_38_22]KKQ66234.1 MAG: hypothetical protein US87_C0002G0041 [Candidatus Falkowbacteria bacterium GW2011_GWE2_38_254]KKQ70962.1 MAG: hypothetical protein US91_C0002G0041 [Candidatus Falkowb